MGGTIAWAGRSHGRDDRLHETLVGCPNPKGPGYTELAPACAGYITKVRCTLGWRDVTGCKLSRRKMVGGYLIRSRLSLHPYKNKEKHKKPVGATAFGRSDMKQTDNVHTQMLRPAPREHVSRTIAFAGRSGM